nr:uncharacterized protein LOC109173561 [Ipomoea batatas]
MVRDIWDWCERKGLERVMFEFDNNQWLSVVPNPERGEVKCSVCTARVNCLASYLANRAEGEDVIWIGGALPKGFQNLVALEVSRWADDEGVFCWDLSEAVATSYMRLGQLQNCSSCRQTVIQMGCWADDGGSFAGITLRLGQQHVQTT